MSAARDPNWAEISSRQVERDPESALELLGQKDPSPPYSCSALRPTVIRTHVPRKQLAKSRWQ